MLNAKLSSTILVALVVGCSPISSTAFNLNTESSQAAGKSCPNRDLNCLRKYAVDISSYREILKDVGRQNKDFNRPYLDILRTQNKN